MKKLFLTLPFYVSAIFAADALTLIKTDIQNLEKKADRITMELRDLEREMRGLTLDEFSYTQKKSLTNALIKTNKEIAEKKPRLLEREIAQLNEDIRLIDCELGKKVTTIRYPGGSTCTNFDISSKESMDLLGERAVKFNALESKQQELASLIEKQ